MCRVPSIVAFRSTSQQCLYVATLCYGSRTRDHRNGTGMQVMWGGHAFGIAGKILYSFTTSMVVKTY